LIKLALQLFIYSIMNAFVVHATML